VRAAAAARARFCNRRSRFGTGGARRALQIRAEYALSRASPPDVRPRLAGVGIAVFSPAHRETTMNPQLTFVARLRRERQRRGVTLDQIAAQTRVKRELLEAFEQNDLTDWPRGLYARAWVRGYAVAVGLDPADTVDEFCRLYLHGDRRARGTIREIAEISSSESQYRDEPPHEERRRSARREQEAAPRWYRSVLQLGRMLRHRVGGLWARAVAPEQVRGSETTSRSA
jgi:cytoskeletal protein RodZ